MRKRVFSALVLAMSLYFLPVLAAQSPQSEAPAMTPPVNSEPSRDEGSHPQVTPPPNQPAASNLTLPAGTIVRVRATDMLSSDRNRPGDGFSVELDQPLVAQGLVVARRGQTAVGQVVVAQSAGRVQGVSRLAVELNELVLVDGQQVPIRTQLIESAGGTSHGRDAQGVGTATGIGAVIGAAAGGGRGAAIGAAAGAAAGVAGVLTTRGHATEIYPESVLTFRLEEPVPISTQQSRQAFRPVTPEDYDGNRAVLRNPSRYPPADGYPRPPYYYSPYDYYYYPPPGFGGYYGFGPGFYMAPRVHFGRGFYRHR